MEQFFIHIPPAPMPILNFPKLKTVLSIFGRALSGDAVPPCGTSPEDSVPAIVGARTRKYKEYMEKNQANDFS